MFIMEISVLINMIDIVYFKKGGFILKRKFIIISIIYVFMTNAAIVPNDNRTIKIITYLL